jgi:tetratricopeptide (TPR) repeat protein
MSVSDVLLMPVRITMRLLHRRRLARVVGVTVVVALAGAVALFLWVQSYYGAAVRALNEDRLDDADSSIDSYLAVWPADRSALLLAARIARLQGKINRAQEHLRECERHTGMDGELQLQWLLLRAFAGEFAKVEPGLLNCLAQEPDKEPQTTLVLETIAFCSMREFRFENALACLNRWLTREPDTVRALDWRGWVKAKMENKEGLYKDYHRTLELAPWHWQTRLRLAEALLMDANVEEAAEHLELLQHGHSETSEVMLALAQCRMLQGKEKAAQAIVDRVLATQPHNAMALFTKAKLAPEPARREEWARKALEADPALFNARYLLYTALQQQHRDSEAAEQFKRYQRYTENQKNLNGILKRLERMPRSPELLTQAGEIFLHDGNEHFGKQFLFRALEIQPRNQKAYECLARFYENKDPKEAARYKKLAIQSAPPAGATAHDAPQASSKSR